jgi:hypothetical protein
VHVVYALVDTAGGQHCVTCVNTNVVSEYFVTFGGSKGPKQSSVLAGVDPGQGNDPGSSQLHWHVCRVAQLA